MNLTNGWLLKKRPNVATISLPWQAKNVNYRREFTANFGLDQRLHFRQVLLYASIALLFFGISIMLLTMFVVVVFWDSQRLLVLASLAGLFLWGIHLFTVILSAKDALAQKYPAMTALY